MRLAIIAIGLVTSVAAAPAQTSRSIPDTHETATTQIAATTQRTTGFAATTQSTTPFDLPDRSTPKAALKSLAAAMEDGNVAAMSAVLYAASADEQRMVTAMAEMAAAQAAMKKESIKAFGEIGAKDLVGTSDPSPVAALQRIDAAQVTIKDDQATVSYGADPSAAFVLKRVDEAWRLPVSSLAKGADAKIVDQRVADVIVQARIIQDLTAEIAAGKYRNAAQASDAWSEKIMQSLSTRPSTGPATRGMAAE